MHKYFFIIVLLTGIPFSCWAEDTANDPIHDTLEKAKATFAANVEKAKSDFRGAFDAQIQEVAKTGILEHTKSLLAEKKAFEEDGKLPTSQPMKKAVTDYQAAMDNARKTLITAYQAAVSDYTKKLQIDKAGKKEPLSKSVSLAQVIQAKDEKPVAKTLNEEQMKIPADAVAYKGHHYKFFDDKLTWHFARAKCEKTGGHLICIGDSDEDSFAIGLLKKANVESAWIGATDEVEQGIWRWVNGEPFSYTHWGPDQPDNFHGWETCLEIHTYPSGTKGWNDMSEGMRQGYICEWDR
jgi:hypothetical protein